MIQIKEKSKCTGCGACLNVCPKKCISMKPDELGFLYPTVDEHACISCGLCDRTCPVISDRMHSDDAFAEVSYAIKSRDIETRMNSSSGGVFSLLAQRIIEEGGVVYGAAFDDKKHVRHTAATTASDIIPLRGSKIVQSSIGLCYEDVKRRLENGCKVLFSGTPCQIRGLLSYLGKPYDLLLTQDIICHGVCSYALYDKYIAYKKEIRGCEIRSIHFRNKETGWRDYSVSICYDDGSKTVVPHGKDELMRAYLRNYALRPSCYECPFKGKKRRSDLTLADCWGIEHVAPQLDDDKGVSFVICHSVLGEQYINEIITETESEVVNYKDVITYNMSGEISPTEPTNNAEFCNEIAKEPFQNVINKYCRITILSRIKRVVKKAMHIR